MMVYKESSYLEIISKKKKKRKRNHLHRDDLYNSNSALNLNPSSSALSLLCWCAPILAKGITINPVAPSRSFDIFLYFSHFFFLPLILYF